MNRMLGIRNRIREAVERSGLGQSGVARRAGKARQHVGAIIRGEIADPSVGTLDAIAEALEMPLEALISGQSILPRGGGIDPDAHPEEAFPPAARAFLELHRWSAEAVNVVRAFQAGTYNTSHAWTPDEWFDELAAEHRRRARRVTLPRDNG